MIVIKDDNKEKAIERIENEIQQIYSQLKLADTGIWISVNTLGSLELNCLLNDSSIPIKGYNIGKFKICKGFR